MDGSKNLTQQKRNQQRTELMYTNPDLNDPVDKLANWMSEIDNDRAPIGWEKYRTLARFIIDEFDLKEAVKNITENTATDYSTRPLGIAH